MASPLIQDGAHGKELKLRFDVSRYAPEEIVVKTVDNRLQVGEEPCTNRYRVFVSTNFRNVTASSLRLCCTIFFNSNSCFV